MLQFQEAEAKKAQGKHSILIFLKCAMLLEETCGIGGQPSKESEQMGKTADSGSLAHDVCILTLGTY